MRRMRTTALTLAAALAAVLAQGAAAQDLRTLYEAARGFDAAYLAARAQAESAGFRAAQADALVRPSANLSAGATAANVDPPKFSAGDSNTLQAALGGRWSIYNPANRVQIEQAQRALTAAQAELATAEQDLIVRLAQAYFDVLAAEDTLATARAGKAAIAEQLASAKRAFEVGTATITDTREAQARFDLAQAQEIAADNELRVTRVALDQLVGRQGVAPLPLRAPVTLPPLAPAGADEWVAGAEGRHPVVERARAALEIAQLEVDRARAAEGPTLEAVGSVGGAHYGGRYPQGASGFTRNASVGLQFNLPLYTGGATGNRIKETVALQEKARNDLEGARRAVALGTRTAFFGVQSGAAQVRALEAAEASSKLALEATQLGYKVGVRVNLDVLNAQTQLFQTQRDLARARYEVLVGGLRLRQAAGTLAEGDLEAVNGMLAR
ncbi:MAG: TolC family outer membrane protein [Rhodoferax sp.]|nr:TolC family outer membrane protein [Rhodoferax sp.]